MADEEALLAFDDGLVCPEVGDRPRRSTGTCLSTQRYFLPGYKEGKARAESWTAALDDQYPRRVVAPVPDRTRCASFAENFLNSFRELIGGSSLVQAGR